MLHARSLDLTVSVVQLVAPPVMREIRRVLVLLGLPTVFAGVALTLAVCVGGATALFPTNVDFGEVRVGQAVRVEVPVQNESWLSVLTIEEIKADCGCSAVVSAPREIAPRATGRIVLEVRTGAYSTNAGTTLSVRVGSGCIAQVAIIGHVKAPFAGWPSCAHVHVELGEAGIRVPEAYRDRIESAWLVDHASGFTSDVWVDTESDRIRLPGTAFAYGSAKAIDLVVRLSGEPPVEWAGRLSREAGI